ncbi:hypothetical protein [Paenibacillus beijingensis]|uniref:hypothetical protein n=1 Tax=Paenibacillus beijingensis TaxID=1126833 RepID=UPI00130E5678|nr:hypothetical protein [Paenibacillus beijingensis]
MRKRGQESRRLVEAGPANDMTNLASEPCALIRCIRPSRSGQTHRLARVMGLK